MKPSPAPRSGHTVRELNVFQLPIHRWSDVQRELHRWLGIAFADGNALPSAACIKTATSIAAAVTWYRQHSSDEFPEHEGPLKKAFLGLLGIDFHAAVVPVTWTPQWEYRTYVRRRTPPPWLPAEDRALVQRELQRRPAETPQLGGFFSVKGVPTQRLGILGDDRACVRVVPLRPIPALQSRASGIVDNWSDRPDADAPGVWHEVGGGGEQYRIPKRFANDREWLEIVAPRERWARRD